MNEETMANTRLYYVSYEHSACFHRILLVPCLPVLCLEFPLAVVMELRPQTLLEPHSEGSPLAPGATAMAVCLDLPCATRVAQSHSPLELKESARHGVPPRYVNVVLWP